MVQSRDSPKKQQHDIKEKNMYQQAPHGIIKHQHDIKEHQHDIKLPNILGFIHEHPNIQKRTVFCFAAPENNCTASDDSCSSDT